MKRLLIGLVTALLLVSPAHADQKKPLVVGANGQPSQIGANSTLQTSASTTGAASINLPHGTAPTSPSNGDCWTTTAGFACRVNGGTVTNPPVVTTQAALQALPSTLGKALLSGVLANGDAPPLLYTASASACTLGSGAGDGGSQLPSSDSKCWLASFPSSGVDVRHFGAKGDGTANDTTKIQAAITYACSASGSRSGFPGGVVHLSRGTYYVPGGLVIPDTCPGLYLKGEGHGNSSGTTILSDNSCTAPVIDFYPAATQNYIYGGGVSDVYLYNNLRFGGVFDGSTSCSQPLIRASYGRNMMFNNIRVLSPKIFIKIIGGMSNMVRDIQIDQALQNSTGVFEFMGSGALPDATGQLTRQDVTGLQNVTVFGAPATPGGGNQWYVGLWNHGLSQTINVNSVKFENASIALKVDCTNPGVSAPLLATSILACPGNSFVHDFETECAGSNCISLIDTQSWHFSQPYAACFARTSTSNPSTSGCNNALKIGNSSFTSTGAITIVDGQFNGAQASCVEIGGHQVTITGSTTYGCNAASVGGTDYVVLAPGANLGGSVSLVNNRMCNGPADNTISETGVNIITGSNYNTIALNNWKGCGAGIIGTIGANSVLANNVGP